MNYDHKQALADLIGQIGAMKSRSDEYFKESPPGSDEADKHLRVFCVLKELERLGRAFEDRANGRDEGRPASVESQQSKIS